MTNKTQKDFLGSTVMLGDTVIFVKPNARAGGNLFTGVVKEITPKCVRVHGYYGLLGSHKIMKYKSAQTTDEEFRNHLRDTLKFCKENDVLGPMFTFITEYRKDLVKYLIENVRL